MLCSTEAPRGDIQPLLYKPKNFPLGHKCIKLSAGKKRLDHNGFESWEGWNRGENWKKSAGVLYAMTVLLA